LIEGGAQLGHVRVLPLLVKLEPLRRKISFLDKVKSGPIHPLLDVTFSHEQILAMLTLDRSDYVQGRSAEKHAYTITRIHVCKSNSHLAILCREELAPSRNVSKYLESID
jgi:hypothetical protein